VTDRPVVFGPDLLREHVVGTSIIIRFSVLRIRILLRLKTLFLKMDVLTLISRQVPLREVVPLHPFVLLMKDNFITRMESLMFLLILRVKILKENTKLFVDLLIILMN